MFIYLIKCVFDSAAAKINFERIDFVELILVKSEFTLK